MDFPGPYYEGVKGVRVSLIYEGERIQAEVQKINRVKTIRRETAKRQPGDAHNVKLTLRLSTGTWDQEVEEEHLTLLDGRRFETKNYACDALPARRRKPAERLTEDDEWQTRGLARGGKKQPKRERLTYEAIEDLIIYFCKEPKSQSGWYIARDKHAETDISRLKEERDDYFYWGKGPRALEDCKWFQGKQLKKGIRIVRRSRNAVTLEGEDKSLVFRLSGETHDDEPVYRLLAGSSQRPRKQARAPPAPAAAPVPAAPVAPPALAPPPPPLPAAPVAAPAPQAAPPAAAPVQPAAPAEPSPPPLPPPADDDDELRWNDEDEDEFEALPQPPPQPKPRPEDIIVIPDSSDEDAEDDDSSDEPAPQPPVRAPRPPRQPVVPEAAAAEVAELGRVVATLDLERVPTQYFGVTKITGVKANDATRTHEDAVRKMVRFCRKYRPDGCFSSIYVSRKNNGKCHTDDGNAGPNSIIALDGDEPFVGGELELGIGSAAVAVDVRAFARGDGDPLFDFDATRPHRKLPHEGDRTAVVFYRHNPVTMRGLSSSDRAYLVGLGFPLPPFEAEVEAYDEKIERKHLEGDRIDAEAAETERAAKALMAEAKAKYAEAAAKRAA